MTDLNTLENKINELEARLKKIEDKINSPAEKSDKEYMDALYKKAKEIVVKYNKSSIIFLQKKLIIDYQRATRLFEELRANGIVK